MTAKRQKIAGMPPDQCEPSEMVEVLLSRLKDCQLDESKKSVLCVELNDLLWFFEKHPESASMFRTDLLEWRTFLKQSKTYMDDMFETKMARTKKIMDHVTGKDKIIQCKETTKGKSQPSYYHILFRPGIRSVRQYPINEEHYGEHNASVDQLHKQIATLREEIIYAPRTKMSRVAKRVMLDILLSIVEICAYDVLDGVGFLNEMKVLTNSIVEGDEFRENIGIVHYMSSLTSKLKEHAKCHWAQGITIKRNMWNDIASIEKDLELKTKPKFDLELLSKSDFLRMEKMKDISSVTNETTREDDSAQVLKDNTKDEGRAVQQDLACGISDSLYEPSSLATVVAIEGSNSHAVTSTRVAHGCENSEYRVKNNIQVDIQMSETSLANSTACPVSSRNFCISNTPSKLQLMKVQPAENSDSSPVIEWAKNVIATYGGACRCDKVTDGNEIDENKSVKYVPDAAVEEETLFKSKKYPRTKYGILKRTTIPPAPDDTDLDVPLIDVMRVELEGDQDDRVGNSPEALPTDLNPYLGRRRLLKY